MRDELKDICAVIIVVVVVVGGIVLVILGLAQLSAGIMLGQELQTVGYVRLYEQSSWITPHTWIVLETHGGVEAEFTLLGYHEFNVGERYQINTICRRGGLWGTENWYEVTDIQTFKETS